MTTLRKSFEDFIGQEPKIITEAIETNHFIIGEVLDFALTLPTGEGLKFCLGIMGLTIPHNLNDRDNYLKAVNNAIVFSCMENKWEEAAKISDDFREYVPENIYIAHSAACAYAHIGEKEKALTMVELAVEHGYEHLDLLKADGDLDSIKDEPRFKAAFEKEDDDDELTDLVIHEEVEGQKLIFRLLDYGTSLQERETEVIEKIKSQFDEILKIAYEGILEFYRSHYEDYKKGFESEGSIDENLLPTPQQGLEIEDYLSDLEIYLIPKGENEAVDFALMFECTWDVEHGVGVRFKDYKIDRVELQPDIF